MERSFSLLLFENLWSGNLRELIVCSCSLHFKEGRPDFGVEEHSDLRGLSPGCLLLASIVSIVMRSQQEDLKEELYNGRTT
jgi:hypothetical protein